MHELAFAEGILQTALRHASRTGARRIAHLHLAVGQLSTVVVSLIQSHWETISRGTLAEGAQLHFRRVPTQVRCLACERQYAPTGSDLACPSCHSTRIKVIAGDECHLERLDLEPHVAFQVAFVESKRAD
jgi:hydrogenase nickel incorporation protein HypA/HybF